eukprot:TRINITY_DN2648_c1_g1_i3.p1 TRINITY_DN2648_c1_g1~~TRINITY_DN2648_c1_g1_i3.p1  ORF type:complete len:639 (+),score=140.92 TRINITY_DN2648_c1_g1_i3:149-1918(+)
MPGDTCLNFLRGTCTYRDKCWFRHDVAAGRCIGSDAKPMVNGAEVRMVGGNKKLGVIDASAVKEEEPVQPLLYADPTVQRSTASLNIHHAATSANGAVSLTTVTEPVAAAARREARKRESEVDREPQVAPDNEDLRDFPVLGTTPERGVRWRPAVRTAQQQQQQPSGDSFWDVVASEAMQGQQQQQPPPPQRPQQPPPPQQQPQQRASDRASDRQQPHPPDSDVLVRLLQRARTGGQGADPAGAGSGRAAPSKEALLAALARQALDQGQVGGSRGGVRGSTGPFSSAPPSAAARNAQQVSALLAAAAGPLPGASLPPLSQPDTLAALRGLGGISGIGLGGSLGSAALGLGAGPLPGKALASPLIPGLDLGAPAPQLRLPAGGLGNVLGTSPAGAIGGLGGLNNLGLGGLLGLQSNPLPLSGLPQSQPPLSSLLSSTGAAEEVAAFVLRHGGQLDGRSVQELRQQSPEVQREVIFRGDLRDALNPSAVRIREAGGSGPLSGGGGGAGGGRHRQNRERRRDRDLRPPRGPGGGGTGGGGAGPALPAAPATDATDIAALVAKATAAHPPAGPSVGAPPSAGTVLGTAAPGGL